MDRVTTVVSALTASRASSQMLLSEYTVKRVKIATSNVRRFLHYIFTTAYINFTQHSLLTCMSVFH